MLDILFDIEKRDVVMQDGDFATTTNPSVQNGGILLRSRCANVTYPMSGIGIDEMINSGGTIATFEMNRWQQQVKDDGGEAKWSSKGSQIDFQPETEVNYE